MLMMMNEEKQPFDVSKQPIVFSGYISFLCFCFCCLILMYSKQFSFFISSFCLFVKTNRGRFMMCFSLLISAKQFG